MGNDGSVRARNPVTSSRVSRQSTTLKCKTCIACRRRKTKCDKNLPRCGHCRGANLDCVYPDDARSLHKSHGGEIRRLQSDIESLRSLLQAERSSNAGSPVTPRDQVLNVASPTLARHGQSVNDAASPLSRTSTVLTNTRRKSQNRGPSSPELHLAGSVSGNGRIQVHGASSMLHGDPTSRLYPKEPLPISDLERKQQNEITKARLVAYASQQQQMEDLVRQDPNRLATIDFDGVQPDLALHLIDAHFNRQHFTFMITYRPAIMDSLINGGPYCNKILLNAIYLSSSIYSNHSDSKHENEATNHRFLTRLRSLFAEYIDKPSIPTAAGLLLSGAILVSMGDMSAGWVHTGIAYRMILDLGCHLTVEDGGSQVSDQDSLQTDIHVETRKRLFWGAFLTDATQSLYFGRPPTLVASQARASHQLLDTFEELQVWVPYNGQQDTSHQTDGSYTPRPAYAISTFNSKVELFEMSSRIISTFYSMESLNMSSADARTFKHSVEESLDQWFVDLPDYLKLDLDGPVTFAPHQMALLTTFHTFQILLRRPYTANGHLSHHFDHEDRQSAEDASIDAALAIHKLVAKYKSAFGLHRAPYLISYSIYSAIVAILNQESQPRSQFKDCMKFYWSALGELRRGSNFGLQKPMEILKCVLQDVPDLADNWDAQDLGFVQDCLQTDSRGSILNSMQTNNFANEGASNGLFDDVLFGLFMNNIP